MSETNGTDPEVQIGRCQALKRDGKRCKAKRAVNLCRDPRRAWKEAWCCPAHWRNSPEFVITDVAVRAAEDKANRRRRAGMPE